jgi:competence protein ComEC
LLLPRGIPARWLGVIWLLPLFWLPPPRPERGEIWLTLLDVGQGLSVAVQTQKHFLVYDTGPRYSPTFDAGRAVVLPFMHHQGIHLVDMLILSHEDIDHMGGAGSLRAGVPVERILGNVTGPLARLTRCERGQRWHWDGVEFAILHPLPDTHTGRNNESCVLRITGPAGTILLTGDIEQQAEFQLRRFYSGSLQADILVVPHHGSQTSSTEAFVAAVAPRYALFAVGYRNRFRLPHRAVLTRYQRLGAEVYSTAQHGAITFVLKPGAAISEPRLHRLEQARVWHHDASASDQAKAQ